ncbi:ABC transporter permease [Gemmata massiliana]|nr:ABC transporter permease [Gemmata massiliana]
MATVEETRRSDSADRARDPQVYHPLDRLRGTIRRYILIEGAISAFLFVAAWFVLGLVLDFVLFKVSGWDWALDASRGIRTFALVTALALFAAFLVFRIVTRLTKEFSYPALALVLERKFPKLLGDRLITAVEMADVESMGKFGYSKEMIRVTIAEARERVGQVPVREVFDWRRLWVMGFLALGLLVGTVAVAFASHAVATKAVSPYRFGWKFAHVTGIFLERNVALANTPWPRRAHLELVGFPEGEATVSRDVATVPVTVRAYKWVVADSGARQGWRPMLWSDVTEGLVGRKAPELDFEALRFADEPVGSLPKGASEWTVDSVERRVFVPADAPDESLPPEAAAHRASLRENLGEKFNEVQEVFKALSAKADQPSMGRTLRKLELTRWVTKTDKDGVAERDDNGQTFKVEVPVEVSFKYAGAKFRGGGTLTPKQNSEFSGEVGGLKEDVEFVVKADDFATQERRIRLIPPPTLKRLYRIQEEPAYLHHAPPADVGFDYLKGKRQVVVEKNLSLTGERSVFVVPAGTQVLLLADAYTDDKGELSDNDAIVSAVAVPVVGKFPGAKFGDDGKMTQTPVPLQVTEGGKGFSLMFRNLWDDMGPFSQAAVSVLKGAYPDKDARPSVDFRLKDPVEFKVTFTNKYNVSTTRSILIQVTQDQPPVVEAGVDVIRKSGNVYLVTPVARIPFNPDSFIKDDHGLSKVEFQFNYYAEDSDVVRGVRTKYALRSLLDAPGAGPRFLPALLLPRLHADNFRQLDTASERLNASAHVGEFVRQDRKLRRETKERVGALLKTPTANEANPEAVVKVELKTGDDIFDLKFLDDEKIIKILAPPGEVQPTYRMDLYIQATDNNADADGGPRVTRSSEPIRLRIVSEGELLLEISKEEEQLGTRLDEALVKLAAAKRKYDFVRNSNGFKDETPEQVDAVKVRHQDIFQDVEKARDIVSTVLREFRRIHRECEVNRVIEVTTNNYLRYCGRLEGILSEDPQASVAFPKTLNLMNNVQNVLNTGRWAPLAAVSDSEQSLWALEQLLAEIRKEIGESQNKEFLIKSIKKIKDDQLLVEAQIEKLKRDVEGILLSDKPKLGPIGAVALAKNEAKKLSHTINWAKYKEDDLTVKVTASDPSITVPAELKLNFEANQFRFEYEVKAGAKEGTYKITLSPAVGDPVEVTVTVK